VRYFGEGSDLVAHKNLLTKLCFIPAKEKAAYVFAVWRLQEEDARR